MSRKLKPHEQAEARQVFGAALDYDRLRVSEGRYFPNFIADVGALLRGAKRRVDNAVTLGDTSFFPRELRAEAGNEDDMAWLIHELTHQWQFQRFGWRYLWEALQVQLNLGPAGYTYTDAKHGRPQDALRAAFAANKRFADFNREQQGDIARDYYRALKRGEDLGAWDPFFAEMGKLGRPADAARE